MCFVSAVRCVQKRSDSLDPSLAPLDTDLWDDAFPEKSLFFFFFFVKLLQRPNFFSSPYAGAWFSEVVVSRLPPFWSSGLLPKFLKKFSKATECSFLFFCLFSWTFACNLRACKLMFRKQSEGCLNKWKIMTCARY